MTNKKFVIGSHVSLSYPEFLLGSVKEAISYGANALMVYTGPPQSSKRTPLNLLKVEEAWKLMEMHNIKKSNIIVHAPYIINLASSDETKRKFGIDFLSKEIDRANFIGAKYIVLHPGNSIKAPVDVAINNLQKSLNDVLMKTKNVIICLETMAGKGTEIGKNFFELKQIISKVNQKNRIKVCFDTCHVHDSGYDLSNLDNVLEHYSKYMPLKNIQVFHLNDSLNQVGSKCDRHANINKGFIGIQPLINLIKKPIFEGIPFILETPYVNSLPPYKEEIELINSFI